MVRNIANKTKRTLKTNNFLFQKRRLLRSLMVPSLAAYYTITP